MLYQRCVCCCYALGWMYMNPNPPTLAAQAVYAAEADAYWCLCKLLDGIQDHYTHAQPGIQRTVFRLKELVRCACVRTSHEVSWAVQRLVFSLNCMIQHGPNFI